MNKVLLLGYLGRDAESQEKNGLIITRMTVATSDYYKDNNGDKKQVTEWHNIVVFNRLASQCATLKKGEKVFIDGKLRSSEYTDADGNKRRILQVVANSVEFVGSAKAKETKSDDLLEDIV